MLNILFLRNFALSENQIASMQSEMQSEFGDVKHRITRLEIAIAGIRRDEVGAADDLDAQRARALAVDGAEPGERRRMPIDDRDDRGAPRHLGQQALDMGLRTVVARFALAARGGPAGVEPIRRQAPLGRPCFWK